MNVGQASGLQVPGTSGARSPDSNLVPAPPFPYQPPMTLRQRSREPEIFDDASRPVADVAADYAQLARVNRVFRHADPFTRVLQRTGLPQSHPRLSFLEIGAGAGQLAADLAAWATRRGWTWTFTCLDQSPVACSLNPCACKVIGDATQLPFPDAGFDLVIASQMTHHLPDDRVIQHFREAWRVARRGVVVSDLHRHPFLYGLLLLSVPFLSLSPRMRRDGLLSVRRGFRTREWQDFAAQAGIPKARVEVQFGCRIVLSAFRD